MLVVGLSASSLIALLGSSAQKMASCVEVRLLVVGSYVGSLSSRQLRIVEYYREDVPSLKSLPRLEHRRSFEYVTLDSIISSSKRTNFA